MDGFCDPADVRKALQELELGGKTNTSMVEAAIGAVSDWFGRRTNGHWYDSSGTSSPLVATVSASASSVRLDVPSSPHPQDNQVHRSRADVRYPVTTNGPYAKIPLPHRYVDTVTTLNVRDRDGDVTDWVASSDKAAGRGEDYYVQRHGQDSYGQTYLYIRAASIGARQNYDGLLTLEYDYGLDAVDEDWQDVRRGIAHLAAAQVVLDDNVLAQIPDNGQLVGVDTQRDAHLGAALNEAHAHLSPYLETSTR